jgi:hypothetical protein
MEPYKVLQTILEKIREGSDQARYSRDQIEILKITMENQERLAEALLIIGAALQVIVDKQVMVSISAPPKNERN